MKTDKAFVAYIDILGYSDFIRAFKPEEYAEIITQSLGISDGFENSQDIIFKTLVKYVSVNVLSDSIIVALDMNVIEDIAEVFTKVRAIKTGNQDRLYRSVVTSVFFTILSSITVEFISKTGFLLRGAVDFGHYAVLPIRGNRDKLIHSDALVRAFDLEKTADLPRVILSKAVIEELKLLSSVGKRQSYILNDFDGVHILNTYKTLGASDPRRVQRVLGDIIKNVMSRLPSEDDIKKRRKYDWFRNFHNQRVMALNELKQSISTKHMFRSDVSSV